MNNNIIQILEMAKSLIVDKGWTQGQWARDRHNAVVLPEDTSATCYCAEGAIKCAMYHFNYYPPQGLLSPGNEDLVYTIIPNWNDDPNRTKEQVIQAFDNAIEYWKRYDLMEYSCIE